MYTHLVIYTDGASRNNPGPAATGIVVVDSMSLQIITLFGSNLGHATNNEAEYQALLEAATWLLEHKALLVDTIRIDFRLDAQLVVSQMQGLYGIKEPRLQLLASNVRKQLEQLPGTYGFEYIPRSQNAKADRIANDVLDGI